MRTTTVFFILLLAGLACLQSCKKDSVETGPLFKKGDVLFIGGGVDTNGHVVAAYWKNNVMTRLSNDPYNLAGAAMTTGLAVSGNDLYAVGYVSNPVMETAAVYWKNGVLIRLADWGSYANSIYISGTDVYIAGTVSNKAVYWKNGVLNTLSGNPLQNSDAESVFVSGNDVYVSGAADDGSLSYSFLKAAYWKNNVPVQLTGGVYSRATGISVVGTDIYICGYTANASSLQVATLWKNGIPSFLETTSSMIFAMTISGSDIYAAGLATANNGATYWKNGVSVSLGGVASGSPTLSSAANCIAVSGTDLYIGGQAGPNYQSATIWKNGVETKLSDVGTITGIYIVP